MLPMPILESDTARSARRTVLLTVGLGTLFGLFFGLPPALSARAMGLQWMPYGAALILSGLIVGLSLAYLVMAFLLDAPYPHFPVSAGIVTPVMQPRVLPGNAQPLRRISSVIGRRLADGNARLERLDADRDSRFAETTAQRIVWSELLELELQDIDEQMSRILSRTNQE